MYNNDNIRRVKKRHFEIGKYFLGITNSQARRRPCFGVCMYLMYLKAEPWLKLTAASGQVSNSQFNYTVDRTLALFANCNDAQFSLENKLLSCSYQTAYAVNNEGVFMGPTQGPYILEFCMGPSYF